MSRLVLLLIAIAGYLYWSGFFTPKPPPEPEIIPWTTPRTIRTANGQRYENATIHSLAADGGIVINYRGNTFKIASQLVTPDTREEVARAAPAPSAQATPKRHSPLDPPLRSAKGP